MLELSTVIAVRVHSAGRRLSQEGEGLKETEFVYGDLAWKRG